MQQQNRGNQNRHGTKGANARTARKSFAARSTLTLAEAPAEVASRGARGELSK